LVLAAPTRMEMASVVTWVTNDATSNTINRALNLVLPLAVTFVSHLPPRPRHDAQEDAYQSRGERSLFKRRSLSVTNDLALCELHNERFMRWKRRESAQRRT
jgi:hypothetical protein